MCKNTLSADRMPAAGSRNEPQERKQIYLENKTNLYERLRNLMLMSNMQRNIFNIC